MRVWEIREGQDKGPDRMGMRHNPEEIEKIEKEAYECGFEDGYEKSYGRNGV